MRHRRTDAVRSGTAPDTEPAEDESALVRFLPDAVFGANDGIITTFAVVSGVVGAGLATRVILILGISNLLADGFSMAASNYLAIRSRTRDEVMPTRLSATSHGTATFVAFVCAGGVALLAFIVPLPRSWRVPVAVVLTLATLFGVGVVRGLLLRRAWWRSGGEMLLVGAAAAAVAYVAGALVSIVAGGSPNLP